MFMVWKLFSATANLSNHNSNCQLVQEKKNSTKAPRCSQNFALNFLFFYLLPVDAHKVLRPYALLSLQRCRLTMVRIFSLPLCRQTQPATLRILQLLVPAIGRALLKALLASVAHFGIYWRNLNSSRMMAQRLLNHKLTCSIEGQHTEVPLPAAYTRQVSYGYMNDQHHDPDVYTEVKEPIVQSPESEVSSLEDGEQEISTGKRQKSVLIFLRSSRFYIRVLAILIMIASFSLILTAVIMFSKAQKKPGNPLSSVPQPAPITDKVRKVLYSCILITLSHCSESMSHSSFLIYQHAGLIC
jgi:hypothetical protein